MHILVSADKLWGIGLGEKRLVQIPNEGQILREETRGKTIVMGRKTFEQLPGAQPLHGRTNIVLSRDGEFAPKNVVVLRSAEELFTWLLEHRIPTEEVYVLGGESIFVQLISHCDTVHVTHLNYSYHADRFFPDLDLSDDWKMVLETEEETYFDLEYCFRMYRRKLKN